VRSGVGWLRLRGLGISQSTRDRLDDERGKLLRPDDGHPFIGGSDRTGLDLGPPTAERTRLGIASTGVEKNRQAAIPGG
jgi:hypothetical protein